MELHSGLVHFPIALLVIGAVFEVLARTLKRDTLSASAHYVIISAAVIGIATAGTGLLAAKQVQDPEIAQTLALHKALGLTVVGVAVVLSIWRISARKSLAGGATAAYLLLLLVGAGFAIGTGWLGGQIAHGGHSHDEHSEAVPHVESLPAPGTVDRAEDRVDGKGAAQGEEHHDSDHSSDHGHQGHDH
ncbi:MAG: DUF2231 domain-containing protein [Armatimonadetes bacterium]|nr:DUF2231 domain-containing protein [Armatimonadota bacterium]